MMQQFQRREIKLSFPKDWPTATITHDHFPESPVTGIHESEIQHLLEKITGCGHALCTDGSQIDILTPDEVIEIKRWITWPHAMGQILNYQRSYPDRKMRVLFFDKKPTKISTAGVVKILSRFNINASQVLVRVDNGTRIYDLLNLTVPPEITSMRPEAQPIISVSPSIPITTTVVPPPQAQSAELAQIQHIMIGVKSEQKGVRDDKREANYSAVAINLLGHLLPQIVNTLKGNSKAWNATIRLFDTTIANQNAKLFSVTHFDKTLSLYGYPSIISRYCSMGVPEKFVYQRKSINPEFISTFLHFWLIINGILDDSEESLQIICLDYTLTQILTLWYFFAQFKLTKLEHDGSGPLHDIIRIHLGNVEQSGLPLSTDEKALLSLYYTSLFDSIPEEQYGFIEKGTLNLMSPLCLFLKYLDSLLGLDFKDEITTRMLSMDRFINSYGYLIPRRLEAKRRYNYFLKTVEGKEGELWSAPPFVFKLAQIANITPKREIIAAEIATYCPRIKELRAMVIAARYMTDEAKKKYIKDQFATIENIFFYPHTLPSDEELAELVKNFYIICDHIIFTYCDTLDIPVNSFAIMESIENPLPDTYMMFKILGTIQSAKLRAFIP